MCTRIHGSPDELNSSGSPDAAFGTVGAVTTRPAQEGELAEVEDPDAPEVDSDPPSDSDEDSDGDE